MAKIGELRELGSEDLAQRLMQLDKKLFELRIQQGTGQADQPNTTKQLRRERAQIKTLLNEREREQAAQGDS